MIVPTAIRTGKISVTTSAICTATAKDASRDCCTKNAKTKGWQGFPAALFIGDPSPSLRPPHPPKKSLLSLDQRPSVAASVSLLLAKHSQGFDPQIKCIPEHADSQTVGSLTAAVVFPPLGSISRGRQPPYGSYRGYQLGEKAAGSFRRLHARLAFRGAGGRLHHLHRL